MESNKETLPADYEACGTCGCDHAYDLPFLSAKELEEVKKLHANDEV